MEIILILLILFFVLKLLNHRNKFMPEREGEEGEKLLYNIINNNLSNDDRIIRNLYLEFDDGKYSQVDMLCITKQGIIVVESKNFDGWIYGNENSKYWMQIIYNARSQFFNPVRQNNIHISVLKKIIKKYIQCYSVIAFSDVCEFKDVKVYSKGIYVCHYSDIPNIILNIKCKDAVLSDGDINDIYNDISKYASVDENVKHKHLERVNKKYDNKEIIIRNRNSTNFRKSINKFIRFIKNS